MSSFEVLIRDLPPEFSIHGFVDAPVRTSSDTLESWREVRLEVKSNVLLLYDSQQHFLTDIICLSNYLVTFSPTQSDMRGTIVEMKHETSPCFDFIIPSADKQRPPPAPLQTPPNPAQAFIEIIQRKTTKISRSDFEFVQILGVGGYGDVHLVKKYDTDALYAMKVLSKTQPLRFPSHSRPVDISSSISEAKSYQKKKEIRALGYAASERKMLSSLHHPFIVKLCFAFQDEKAWYLCVEHCPYSLSKVLKAKPQITLPEELIRMIAAELVCALCYLHQVGVAHRDVKPGNVLFDEKFHVRLIDFGLAKHLPFGTSDHDVCGTKYFISPEMADTSDHSHTLAIDWWSLGILLYEMFYGKPPFYNKDKAILAELITKGEPNFSNRLSVTNDSDSDNDAAANSVKISPSLQSLITELLAKNPEERLGNRQATLEESQAELKQHAFFQGIDWKAVEEKRLLPSKFEFLLKQNQQPSISTPTQFVKKSLNFGKNFDNAKKVNHNDYYIAGFSFSLDDC